MEIISDSEFLTAEAITGISLLKAANRLKDSNVSIETPKNQKSF